MSVVEIIISNKVEAAYRRGNLIEKRRQMMAEWDAYLQGQDRKVIPISKSSWWNGVKSGKYPKPVKLGENTTVWKETDIRELIERLS